MSARRANDTPSRTRVLVTGAGGFIGHHLVKYLAERGYWVRAVAIKAPAYEPSAANEFLRLDLRCCESCAQATAGVEEVYALAADTGWDGFISAPGREKAPAARCRRVAIAKVTGSPEIEIWGDGDQTRSFCYIDDCVEGIYRLMRSDYAEPLNPGQDRMVTINELANMVASAAGVRISKGHVDGPQGVRGRNSENRRLGAVLGWEPRISLEEGLAKTDAWIEAQVRARLPETAGPLVGAAPQSED